MRSRSLDTASSSVHLCERSKSLDTANNPYISEYRDRETLIRQTDECASYYELETPKVSWRRATHNESATMTTFKACWSTPFLAVKATVSLLPDDIFNESATMAITPSKPVEAFPLPPPSPLSASLRGPFFFSSSAVKATVSLLQWQRQAPPAPLKQRKRACYNRHLLRSTSQQACYKRLLKEHGQSPPTSSAYGGTLIEIMRNKCFNAATRTSLVKEVE